MIYKVEFYGKYDIESLDAVRKVPLKMNLYQELGWHQTGMAYGTIYTYVNSEQTGDSVQKMILSKIEKYQTKQRLNKYINKL